MKRSYLRSLAFLLVAYSASGCSSKQTVAPAPATGGTDDGAHQDHGTRSASDGAPYAMQASARDGGTNHHFQPRAHEPHYRPQVPPPPALGALPRFVDGSARCFPPPPIYSPPPYLKGGRLGGSYGGGTHSSGRGYGTGVHGGSPGASAPSPSPRSAPKSASRPSDSSSGYAETSPAPERATPPARTQNLREGSAAPWRHDREEPPVRQPESGFGAAVYLSNDDTMSLSSAQRLIYAIDQYAPLEATEVRPHELLNYFSFHTAHVPADHDFSVVPSIAPSVDDPEVWTLGLAIQGRPLTLSSRRNANVSYVVDRSGSMAAEGRMEYVKRGMLRSLSELKHGDIVNVTLFDSTTCHLAQNFVVGRDSTHQLSSLISRIEPRGSTNLHAGLEMGYDVANRVYQPGYTNRVVMITDAETNTGVTDEHLISMVSKHYDERQIRLSGVGVGHSFNDSLLDRLTERGKGAYVFLGSGAEVDAVFGPRFVSLIETVAHDVHFKLHLPPSLKMDVFYGEEASTAKERVQAIHYFANTSQMFLSDLVSKNRAFPGTDDIMLTIEYKDAETGAARVEEFSWQLAEIYGNSPNINKAQLVSIFARDLQQLAARPMPSNWGHHPHSWDDGEAAVRCEATRQELARLSAPISGDPEVSRVQSLWESYCNRYQPVQVAQRSPQPYPYGEPNHPERPLRNNEFAPPDSWPSAVQ